MFPSLNFLNYLFLNCAVFLTGPIAGCSLMTLFWWPIYRKSHYTDMLVCFIQRWAPNLEKYMQANLTDVIQSNIEYWKKNKIINIIEYSQLLAIIRWLKQTKKGAALSKRTIVLLHISEWSSQWGKRSTAKAQLCCICGTNWLV